MARLMRQDNNEGIMDWRLHAIPVVPQPFREVGYACRSSRKSAIMCPKSYAMNIGSRQLKTYTLTVYTQ
eukprot:5115059-Amphidinium_carterae.1